MFYELVHTRCMQGIDVKKKTTLTGEGFKEYACSPEFLTDMAETPLLAEVVRATSPHIDKADASKLMDDAYHYYVPDFGAAFMVNFHPIPWQKDYDVRGRFSNRQGNFTNQVFAGDFTKFYPYELFGDKEWDAKGKEYAYYYDNPPPPSLGTREIKPTGSYSFDKIAEFIADGRKEALIKAVAFLIDQYAVDYKERKFLVIRDVSSENIEKWIAAISCAFSMKIAANLPFSTRMDKFANFNKYTVNQDGRYQVAMNLQDPRQSHRLRAMIVGVDERDRNNAGTARAMASSPFVLLDGNKKQAEFETGDTGNSYYRLISGFSGEHQDFCRVFLQTFGITKPCRDLFEMYEAFTVINKPDSQSASALLNALNVISKYPADNTEYFKNMCQSIEKSLSRHLQTELVSALGIVVWLYKSSAITGDSGIKQRLSRIVRESFDELVFSKANFSAAEKFWNQFKNDKFAKEAFAGDLAQIMTDRQKIADSGQNAFSRLRPPEWVSFLNLYLDCAAFAGQLSPAATAKTAGLVLDACYRREDRASLKEACGLLAGRGIDAAGIVFAAAKDFPQDKGFAEFLINFLIGNDDGITASDNAMMDFCRKLDGGGMGHLAKLAADRRFSKLKPQDLGQFIDTVMSLHSKYFIDKEQTAKFFVAIDKKIQPEAADRAMHELADKLLKIHFTKCTNSAHLVALEVLQAKSSPDSAVRELLNLREHGFPRYTEKQYVSKFVKGLISAQFTRNESIRGVLDMLGEAPDEYLRAYITEVCQNAKRLKVKWISLVDYAAEANSKRIDDLLYTALLDTRQNERSLAELGGLLEDSPSNDYFTHIAEAVLKDASQRKPQKKQDGPEARRESREEPERKQGFFDRLFRPGKK